MQALRRDERTVLCLCVSHVYLCMQSPWASVYTRLTNDVHGQQQPMMHHHPSGRMPLSIWRLAVVRSWALPRQLLSEIASMVGGLQSGGSLSLTQGILEHQRYPPPSLAVAGGMGKPMALRSKLQNTLQHLRSVNDCLRMHPCMRECWQSLRACRSRHAPEEDHTSASEWRRCPSCPPCLCRLQWWYARTLHPRTRELCRKHRIRPAGYAARHAACGAPHRVTLLAAGWSFSSWSRARSRPTCRSSGQWRRCRRRPRRSCRPSCSASWTRRRMVSWSPACPLRISERPPPRLAPTLHYQPSGLVLRRPC